MTTSPAGLSGVSVTYDGAAAVPTNAGSYAVVASLTNANYSAPDKTDTLVIAKANQTISFGALASKTFGDADFTVSATASSGLAVSFSASGDCTVTGSTVHITGAGSCTITASQPGNRTSTPRRASSGPSRSPRRLRRCRCPGWVRPTMDRPHAVSVTTSPAGLSGVSVTYDGAAAVPTNAGSYAVVASLTNANYSAPDKTDTLVIAKADASVSVTWLDSTYDGSSNSASAVVNGVAGESDLSPAATFAYYAGSTATGSPLAGAPTNAGTYTVKASFAGNGNYNPASDTKTITIAKADASVSVTWLDSTYDGSSNSASAVVNGVAGESDLSPAATFAYYAGSTATGSPLAGAPTNAGTYTVKASFAGNGNYNPASDTKTITIAKADASVSVTWLDSTYDGSSNSASAVVNGVAGESDLSPAATFAYYAGSTATGSPLAGAPTNAGTYTVKASFAGNGNYNPASDTKTITIAKADASVSVTWLDSTYDGSSNSASAVVNGVAGESDLSPAATFAYYAGSTATGSPLAGAPTNAGTYTVKASFAGNGNYNPASDTKTITIAKADASVSVTWLDSTYDGSSNSASAVVNGVAGESDLSPAATFAYYAGSTATGSPLAGAPTNAGTYTVKASFAGNGNYNPASDTKTITIAKADASVSVTWLR